MQERRAAGIVEALRKRLQVGARVLRESIWQVIPHHGNWSLRHRPRPVLATSFQRTSSSDRRVEFDSRPHRRVEGCRQGARDVLSSGRCPSGEGNGAVMLTGAQTYFGRTTELVQQAQPKLHIEAVVGKVVRWLFVSSARCLAWSSRCH